MHQERQKFSGGKSSTVKVFATNLLGMKSRLAKKLRISYAREARYNVVDIHPIMSPARRL